MPAVSTPSQPLHIVIIGYVWPEPNSSAAGYHMLSFIELFHNQGWTITFASPASLGDHRADLSPWYVQEVAISLNDASFDAWIAEQRPNVVLFDRFMMEEQFGWRVEKACPDAIRLLDTEDLHSLRDARHQMLKKQLQLTKDGVDFTPLLEMDTLFDYMSPTDLAQREIASIYRCDLTLMISDVELRLLTDYFSVPYQQLMHCPFMINHERSAPASTPSWQQRQHFVSIGNFRHAPNWDAVLWLKQRIWPKIRQALPQAELHIYGAYPPPKATDLNHPSSGFYVKGWAESADEVIQNARVLIAPLRFGAGIKGKLLDAMRNGTPSVTTPIGVEGMVSSQAWPGAIGGSEKAIAAAAVQLYQDEATWLKAQSRIQAILDHRFNTVKNQGNLLYLLNQMLDKKHLAQHRKNNFVGQMLRHHHHKSTQYMSQWIEAKNKLS